MINQANRQALSLYIDRAHRQFQELEDQIDAHTEEGARPALGLKGAETMDTSALFDTSCQFNSTCDKLSTQINRVSVYLDVNPLNAKPEQGGPEELALMVARQVRERRRMVLRHQAEAERMAGTLDGEERRAFLDTYATFFIAGRKT